MLILAFITFKEGKHIAFDQLFYESLHVDEAGVAVFDVLLTTTNQ